MFNLLLQVMDEGRLTDSLGRHIDFKNTIIIHDVEHRHAPARDFGSGVGFATREVDREYCMACSPRLASTKPSRRIPQPHRRHRYLRHPRKSRLSSGIIDIELAGFYKRLRNMGYAITISDEAKNFIASKGCDVQFGAARPLKASHTEVP